MYLHVLRVYPRVGLYVIIPNSIPWCSSLYSHWKHMNFCSLIFSPAYGIGHRLILVMWKCAYLKYFKLIIMVSECFAERKEAEVWSPGLWMSLPFTLGEGFLGSNIGGFNWMWVSLLRLQPLESMGQSPKASGKLCILTQLFNLCEPQSLHLQNGDNLKFLTELVWRVSESVHQKAHSFRPVVIIKKKLWGPCESQEEVAGYTALEHSYIYFSLSFFQGKQNYFTRALDVTTQYILSGTTLFGWCLGGSVCCFEGWLSRTINTVPAQGCSGFVCHWQEKGREGNHLQLVFWHRGVLFFLCQLCILHWKQTKRSSAGK